MPRIELLNGLFGGRPNIIERLASRGKYLDQFEQVFDRLNFTDLSVVRR